MYFSHEELFVSDSPALALRVGVDAMRIDPYTSIIKAAGGDWEIKRSVSGTRETIAWATQNSDGTWSICRPNGSNPFAQASIACVVGEESAALRILTVIAKGGQA